MLVISTFSFSYNIFNPPEDKKFLSAYVLFKPFPKQALVFTCLQYKSFENTVGKGEIARNEQFLLFPQCFLPFWGTVCHFHQIENWRLQTLLVWKGLKLVVWERVKQRISIWTSPVKLKLSLNVIHYSH